MIKYKIESEKRRQMKRDLHLNQTKLTASRVALSYDGIKS